MCEAAIPDLAPPANWDQARGENYNTTRWKRLEGKPGDGWKGVWELESVTYGGNYFSAADLGVSILRIRGGVYEIRGISVEKGIFSVDRAPNPWHIDLNYTDPEKFSGLTRLGVIKIDGDSLQANFATSVRPASVTSELPSASEQFKMTRVASE